MTEETTKDVIYLDEASSKNTNNANNINNVTSIIIRKPSL